MRDKNNPKRKHRDFRLARIVKIIEDVDRRCMAADGPVTHTNDEISLSEIREIYGLAIGRIPKVGK